MSFNLFLQELRFEQELFKGYVLQAELRGSLFSIYGVENLYRRFSIETGARHRIHMIHHQRHIFRLQVIKGMAFRTDVSDVFMITLAAALLIGLLRIAVEQPAELLSGAWIKFDRHRVSKFRSPVGQYDLEDFTEVFAEHLAEPEENSRDVGSVLNVSEEHKLQITVTKEDGKYNFAAFISFDSIHLVHIEIGMI